MGRGLGAEELTLKWISAIPCDVLEIESAASFQ
jgi:hypothetical protein